MFSPVVVAAVNAKMLFGIVYCTRPYAADADDADDVLHVCYFVCIIPFFR